MTEADNNKRVAAAAAALQQAELAYNEKLTSIETRLEALQQSVAVDTLLLERICGDLAKLSKGLGVY